MKRYHFAWQLFLYPVPPGASVRDLRTITPIAEITSYSDLIAAMRLHADQLDVSRTIISEIAGLPDGYFAKIAGPRQVKRIGMLSLGPILSALGMKLVAIPDQEALERNRSRYEARDPAHTKSAKARWNAEDAAITKGEVKQTLAVPMQTAPLTIPALMERLRRRLGDEAARTIRITLH